MDEGGVEDGRECDKLKKLYSIEEKGRNRRLREVRTCEQAEL